MKYGISKQARADIVPVAQALLATLDRMLPGRINGFLVTGSAVLGDWRPGVSDLDFLALGDTRLERGELSVLPRLHRSFRRAYPKPVLDGAYVTWGELGQDPRGLVVPRVREGVFETANGFVANPVTWHTVALRPWAIRGPAKPAAWIDEAALEKWCRENLATYWKDWVGKARNRPRGILYSLSAEAAYWGILGVARIHATIATGNILSKGAAADYALRRFGKEWDDIIGWASAYRRGAAPSLRLSPVARRERFLAFMEMALLDATKIPPRFGRGQGQDSTLLTGNITSGVLPNFWPVATGRNHGLKPIFGCRVSR